MCLSQLFNRATRYSAQAASWCVRVLNTDRWKGGASPSRLRQPQSVLRQTRATKPRTRLQNRGLATATGSDTVTTTFLSRKRQMPTYLGRESPQDRDGPSGAKCQSRVSEREGWISEPSSALLEQVEVMNEVRALSACFAGVLSSRRWTRPSTAKVIRHEPVLPPQASVSVQWRNEYLAAAPLLIEHVGEAMM